MVGDKLERVVCNLLDCDMFSIKYDETRKVITAEFAVDRIDSNQLEELAMELDEAGFDLLRYILEPVDDTMVLLRLVVRERAL